MNIHSISVRNLVPNFEEQIIACVQTGVTFIYKFQLGNNIPFYYNEKTNSVFTTQCKTVLGMQVTVLSPIELKLKPIDPSAIATSSAASSLIRFTAPNGVELFYNPLDGSIADENENIIQLVPN